VGCRYHYYGNLLHSLYTDHFKAIVTYLQFPDQVLSLFWHVTETRYPNFAFTFCQQTFFL